MLISRALHSLALVFGSLFASTLLAQIEPARNAPLPLTPEQSKQQVRLPAGFRLDLVASEPLISDPTCIAWDERGRLFVCELHGYNLDGFYDILELNKTGELDRKVRRVRNATPQAKKAAEKGTYGTVKMLSDTDGDGRMDKSVVWADRLPPCYGIIAVRGGVIVTCAPDIVYLADPDNDGKAEVRETLFSGFAVTYLERGINNPRFGFDNWIYVAAGAGGGTIKGPHLDKPVALGRTDFRFKPDGSAIEPVSGTNGTFGLEMTATDDRLLISGGRHALYSVPLAYHYLARNPFVPSPAPVAGASNYNEVFPISKPHPWRLARSKDPAWVKFYGQRETTANGYLTSACGQVVYRAESLPRKYWGNHFCCEPSQNLIHRCLLERDGSGFKVRRAPGEERSEFLASKDQWFRPMNLRVGPDGAIYIVDMYREIIEDFSAIPRFLQQQYSLINGHDRGRIWRLTYVGTGESTSSADAAVPPSIEAMVVPRLHKAETAALVRELSNNNEWWRKSAQRLLIERGDKSVVPAVSELVRQGQTGSGRLHALGTLEGLNALGPSDCQHALADRDYTVRANGLRFSEKFFDKNERLLRQVTGMIDDPDSRVRLQLGLTLGESRDERALSALAGLAEKHGGQQWMSSAILSSIVGRADQLIERLLAKPTPSPGALALLNPAASVVGAQADDDAVSQLLETTAMLASVAKTKSRLSRELRGQIQKSLLQGLSDGLRRTPRREQLKSTLGRRSLAALLKSDAVEVRAQALQIAGLLRLNDSPLMQEAWRSALGLATNLAGKERDRLQALSLLSDAPWPIRSQLKQLLTPRNSRRLQLAAVDAISRSDEPSAADILLANWAGLSPKVQESVVDAMFARKNRLPKLLDAVESRRLPASSLSALRRAQLLESERPQLRARAARLLSASSTESREAVIKRYTAALKVPRDARQGARVFEKQCSKCHRLKDKGFAVGPDLSGIDLRPDASLLADVMDPSRSITPQYGTYSVATTDGRVFTGVLSAESATSITLRREKGQVDTLLRKDIQAMKMSSKSMMPEGLEKGISVEDMAHLLGYLRESFGQRAQPGIVLFDDEPSFVKALIDGNGTATLITTDKLSGQASLRITPLQRHSRSVAGWKFRIVEHPKPGEFRYLRFAWKSVGAKGVLIELAASGAWPSAKSPLRRYASGQNTSGWQTHQVASSVPTKWTTVTVDLWKDNGSFILTGIAPTAMNGPALFDRIELLRTLPR